MRERRDGYRGRVWRIPEPEELAPIAGTPYPPFVTRLLRRRGITTAAESRRHLFDEGLPPADPRALPGVGDAIARVRQAVAADETIAIYGDFDVDGITATAILTEAIRDVGGSVVPYVPDRFAEGYGLHTSALSELRREHDVGLVITADCGITAVDEVEFAREIGQDVIVVDHHIAPPQLPDTAASINPKLPGSPPELRDLSTAGIAYWIAPLLLEAFGRTAERLRWVELAALSTVADVVPLLGENRRIVRDGLRELRRTQRPGLQALIELAGLGAEELDTEAISFGIAPRLNAAGRLEHARQALNLLLETDPRRAQDQAAQLHQLNAQRQDMTRSAMETAAQRLDSEDPNAPLTFVGDAEISSGIVGLVAGRLAEDRHRPAVVYEEGRELSRASCRSIEQFHFADALQGCDDLLERHGGHAMAAGFTARTDNLPAVKQRLTEIARDRLNGVSLEPVIETDGQVPLAALGGSQVEWMMRLAPFGEANPAPTFVSTNLIVSDAQRVGHDRSHLRLRLRAGNKVLPAIGFRLGETPCSAGQEVDVVWSLRRDGWRGGLEIEVHDLAPAAERPAERAAGGAA